MLAESSATCSRFRYGQSTHATADTNPSRPRGALSSRMLIPGNTWQLVWETAKPVPARRQKRLFDDTKEAEKILHYFESQTIGQIVRLTLAALVHTAIVAMGQRTSPGGGEPRVRLANFAALHERLVAMCCKLSREPWSDAAAGGRSRWHCCMRAT